MGAEKKLKARSAGDKEGKPPRRATPTQVQPVPPGFSPGDARGEAPCIRKLKTSPFPAGEERSASAVGGMGAEKL